MVASKGGRPPTFARDAAGVPALLDQICERLSAGEPLAQICRDEGMPTDRSVRLWCQQDAAVASAIARARELGEDAIAEQCLEIADDARNDWMDMQGEDGESTGLRFNSEHVQRSKLRIETRLKLLAKWNPKKYGDRVAQEISGPAGGPIAHQITVEMVPAVAEAGRRHVIEAQASEEG